MQSCEMKKRGTISKYSVALSATVGLTLLVGQVSRFLGYSITGESLLSFYGPTILVLAGIWLPVMKRK